MKILGRDELLSGESFKRELVPVPELNGEIYMREMDAAGVLAFNARIKEIRGEDKSKETDLASSWELMALAVSLSACDERGSLLYSEADVKQLANNSIAMLSRLSAKALSLSGLGLDTTNQLTSEVAANLKNAPTSSPSGLPTNSRKRKRK